MGRTTDRIIGATDMPVLVSNRNEIILKHLAVTRDIPSRELDELATENGRNVEIMRAICTHPKVSTSTLGFIAAIGTYPMEKDPVDVRESLREVHDMAMERLRDRTLLRG